MTSLWTYGAKSPITEKGLVSALKFFANPEKMDCGQLEEGEDTEALCGTLIDERITGCFAEDITEDINTPISSVLAYGTKSCDCCKNPSQCMFGRAGGLNKFLEGIGVVGGLVAVGGISKVCGDVGKLQAALGALNATAGAMCKRKASQCTNRHQTCIGSIDTALSVIEARISSCDEALGICRSDMCSGQPINNADNIPCTGAVNNGNRTYSIYQEAEARAQSLIEEAETVPTQFQVQANLVAQQAIIDSNKAQQQAQTTAQEAKTICSEAKTKLESTKNRLTEFKTELETEGLVRCNFVDKAGGTQLGKAAGFGAASVASFLCDKSFRGQASPNISCTDEDSPRYNTLNCQCERGEKQAPECCSVNPMLAGCPCAVNPNSTECICQNPAMQGLARCQPRCSPENPELCDSEKLPPPPEITDPPPPPSSTPPPDFQFSSEGDGGDGDVPFGAPNIQLPGDKGKTPFSPGGSTSNKASSGGRPSVGGGRLPSLGGSGGDSGEEAEMEGKSPYSNLLDGLTGRQNKSGAGGMGSFGGGFDSSSGDKPFDLSKFLPKKKKKRKLSSTKKGGPAQGSSGESIFEMSSRVTQVYCNRNQMQCIRSSKK